jgi:hypothetical protein
MNPLRAWQRPVALIEQATGVAALGGLWYWWLGIAESTTGRLALSIAVLLALIAGLWLLVKRGRARLSDAAQPGSAGQGMAALLLLAMSFAAAYYLIWWVPEASGLRAQMASVAVRFGTAFALVVTFWANLLASIGGEPAPRG